MTKSNNNTIIDEYLFYHDKYVKIYGKDTTIVLMMVGGFYEAYATDTLGPNLSKVSEVTNLVKTKKDKTINETSKKNPYMMGFNITALDKFMGILINNGFTVVICDQVTPPPKPKRAITGIYSSGTYISGNLTNDSNYIVSIYIEDEKQLNGNYLTCIGLSSIDLSTGESSVYEVSSNLGDEKYALDEAYRFILSHSPKEIVLTRVVQENISMKKDILYANLEIDDKKVHYNDKPNKAFNKLSFQNEFFKRVFKNSGMLSPIEYLDMEKLNYARLSFIILLDFVHKHNENLINDLNKPEIFKSDKHLILGNNAIYQLNILENASIDTGNAKFKCLLDIINFTSTAIGKRFLKSTIINPLTDVSEIKLRYDCTDEVLKDNLYLDLEKILNNILDIEKLGRKLFLAYIQPYELGNLMDSLSSINDLYKIIQKTKYCSKNCPKKEIMKDLENFIKELNNTFDIDELKKQSLNDINSSFFKKGVYKNIDELQSKVTNNIQSLEEICKILATFIKEPTNKNSMTTKYDKILLKRNDRDGYYLCLTKRRADILKKELEKHKTIKINDTLSISPDKLEFKDLVKGNTKIFFTDSEKTSDDVSVLKEKLFNLIKKTFTNVLISYGSKYKTMFRELSKFIAIIDFIKGNAKTAKNYNYCRPEIINNSDSGLFDAKKLRHPIGERLRPDIEYIPHDIKLGKDGILLFGLNAAGKSTIAKAIGLAIIMAQSGLYVAAESYTFSPYNSVFARITGHDNIFKGQSQFSLEMTELAAIMKRNGPKTLVIGDEVCRGTEHVSGNSIVAATLILLAESGCSFIFATHLHEIAEMKRIKDLENLKIYHLSVIYDKIKDELIFDRLLKPGSGSNIYGLTVAKYIIKDDKFMKLAQEIKNELLGIPNEILAQKTSLYNSNLYISCCQICGKTNNDSEEHTGLLDTHHINFQSKCNELGFVIGKTHLKKNELYNLAVLCKGCHYKVHHNQLKINGYKDTSNGRILDYETFKIKKNSLKHNQNKI